MQVCLVLVTHLIGSCYLVLFWHMKIRLDTEAGHLLDCIQYVLKFCFILGLVMYKSFFRLDIKLKIFRLVSCKMHLGYFVK